MGILDFLKKKKEPLLAFISARVPDAALPDTLPDFARRFLHMVQNYSIQFYRDIHSHDAGGFPAVKEELFYLLFFVVEHHIRNERDPDTAERVFTHLRMLLTEAMSGSDRAFHAEGFWERYRERAAAYSSHHASSLAQEKLIAVFNAQLLSRLRDWPKLIAYHGAQVAGEALAELQGASVER